MQWREWLRARPTPRDSDIEREIRDHLELEAEERRDAGMTERDARDAARRAFGNRTLVAEDVRSVWRTAWLDALVQDLRYALRTMRRAPGFTAIAVSSCALGIGACSVIFTILNAALFKSLPVDDPGKLMKVSEVDRRTGEAGNELSYLDFLDLRRAGAFEGLAAADPLIPASIGIHGEPQRHWGALVTANYFAVVKPAFAVGRGFDPLRDDRRGEPPVVVLSHDLWQRQFGGDAGIVGRPVAINRRSATIIGVTAASFRGTEMGVVPAFWIPFSMIDEVEARSGPVTENRRRFWLTAVGRLRAGVDVAAARAELDVLARTLNTAHGRGAERGFDLERAGQIDPRLRRLAMGAFGVALAATIFVLLMGCGNVANLLLGRASVRRREIAARMALGASRARLVRQLLTESLLLALLGGAGGWIVAAYVSSLLGLVRTPLGWPLDLSVSPDTRVLLFSASLSIVTGVVFGLVPALRATSPNLVADLKADARGVDATGRFGLRSTLVVVQVAICTVLLVCTGLFLRSLQASRAVDVGLTTRNLLLLAFDPSLDRRSVEQSRQLLRDLLDRVRGVPGVVSATLTTGVPLTLIVDNSRFVPADRAEDPSSTRIRTDIYTVGPDFFATMGIRIVAGQDVGAALAAGGRPVIVNDAFARAAFPDRSPIGHRILGDGKALDIVGVVATVKSRTIAEDPRPSIYLPIFSEYTAGNPRGVTLVVRTAGGPASLAAPVREAVRSADPSLAVFDVRTMERHVDDALILPRLMWMLSAAAGTIGLAIAILGVYGVVSFAVARRRREIGIRLAIGARRREIVIMILGHGATLALAGIALGCLAALGITRFTASVLYSVTPTDPLTFVAVPLVLVLVALAACLVPARAAAWLDPADVLRSE
jgi:predicted permease